MLNGSSGKTYCVTRMIMDTSNERKMERARVSRLTNGRGQARPAHALRVMLAIRNSTSVSSTRMNRTTANRFSAHVAHSWRQTESDNRVLVSERQNK